MKVQRTCGYCRGPFQARKADVDRGWARFCSKSCKASFQERRTGQYRAVQSDGCGDPRAYDGTNFIASETELRPGDRD